MYVFENPVLQRELLVNLRTKRAFLLLFVYLFVLCAVVYFAWPRQTRLDANADQARSLVDLFFLGQYILAALMAPTFAAATITGEKERKTYEMLLASPLAPLAICVGKLLSSLAHLALLIIASLPIVMLCLPLGGVSIYEVFAAYSGLIVSVVLFGTISVACSSYFLRTPAALVASYMLILPLALFAVLIWKNLEGQGEFRLVLTTTVLPVGALGVCVALLRSTTLRLLRPPDVGSEGNQVVDLEQEANEAVGLVIRRDQFPDRLFAPVKRDTLMEDGTNVVYDKEIHSEIFSQGTLMLRLVIQISMFLAIPIMALTLFFVPTWVPWYVAYTLIFNMLVGPVFSAGSITSERERQTLDLLLVTDITPWQILWGKLLAGLRISTVLTMFLVWPLFLAVVMNSYYWSNLLASASFFFMILMACATTALVALFCSVIFSKSSTSLMASYTILLLLFAVPIAITVFAKTFMVGPGQSQEWSSAIDVIHWLGVGSPFAAAFATPLTSNVVDGANDVAVAAVHYFHDDWRFVVTHFIVTLMLDTSILVCMFWRLATRWRVAQ